MRYRTLRRGLWVGIALCVAALGLGITEYILGLQPGVTTRNLARVRGLTLPEVEALMGVQSTPGSLPPPWNSRSFVGDDRGATVFFDEQGRATFFVSRPIGTPRPGPWARFLAWLGL
jgi:hypothetical protein